LAPEGRILPGAAARTAEAVKRFVGLARDAGATNSVLVGTHALRTAQNPDELLARLENPVRILTGDEEARLGYQGVVMGLGLSPVPSRLLVVDIGGGSVELTWGRRGQVEASQSVPAGAVVLTERFLAHDPPLHTEIRSGASPRLPADPALGGAHHGRTGGASPGRTPASSRSSAGTRGHHRRRRDRSRARVDENRGPIVDRERSGSPVGARARSRHGSSSVWMSVVCRAPVVGCNRGLSNP
jgi:hypothetical protein